jgi:hypothetical protein
MGYCKVSVMTTLRVITQKEIELRKQLRGQPKAAPEAARTGAEAEETPAKKDDLISALRKYIPVTVLILYTYVDTVFRAVTPPPEYLWLFIFGIMVIGAAVISYRVTADDTPSPAPDDKNKDNKLVQELQSLVSTQRNKQALIAVIAFAGYVMALGGPFAYLNSVWPSVTWQGYFGAAGLAVAFLLIAIITGKDILAS